MTLEQLVQVSQISIPFILALIGYAITKKMNAEQNALQRKLILSQNAAKLFHEKTLSHVDCISEFCTVVQRQGFSPIDSEIFAKRVQEIMIKLLSTSREVEIYKCLSQNTEPVHIAVKSAEVEWRSLFERLKLKTGLDDFGKLFNAQKEIIEKLVEFQNFEILGAPHE